MPGRGPSEFVDLGAEKCSVNKQFYDRGKAYNLRIILGPRWWRRFFFPGYYPLDQPLAREAAFQPPPSRASIQALKIRSGQIETMQMAHQKRYAEGQELRGQKQALAPPQSF